MRRKKNKPMHLTLPKKSGAQRDLNKINFSFANEIYASNFESDFSSCGFCLFLQVFKSITSYRRKTTIITEIKHLSESLDVFHIGQETRVALPPKLPHQIAL